MNIIKLLERWTCGNSMLNIWVFFYRFHRNEILAGAIHEYTDWEKPAQHPLNIREETLEALGDAEVRRVLSFE